MECIEGQHRLEAHRRGASTMSVSKRENVVKELEILLAVAKDMASGVPTTLACSQRGVSPNKFLTFLRRDLFNAGESSATEKEVMNDYFSFEDHFVYAILGKGHAVLPDFKESYEEALSTLKEREAEIIRMRFEDNATLDEVAKIFGITKERVRQIEIHAIQKLRHPYRSRLFSEGFYAVNLDKERQEYERLKKQKQAMIDALRKKNAILHRQVIRLKGIDAKLNEDANYKKAENYYNMFIVDEYFSVRSCNCLRRAGINTLGELMELTKPQLASVRNLGRVSFDDIVSYMAENYNFSFKEE